jgi:hypothetical protein
MKYFFLTEGWEVGRVWEFGGLWNEVAWRRKPEIQRTNLKVQGEGEAMWLHQVEDAVLMVEVRAMDQSRTEANRAIGHVVLKRLMEADQVIEYLCRHAEGVQIH